MAMAATATDVFGVLADPTRRRIIYALREGEHAVGELVAKVGINQPGVSKQLRVLHEAGFVEVRPDRQRRLYSLRGEPLRELDAWLQEYRHLWEARFDRLGVQLEARRRRRDEANKMNPDPRTDGPERGEE
jgi:DNA-binding transcriptional ArsR family regulator